MNDKKLNIRIKKLHPNAEIPKYAKEGDAGMDLTSVGIVYDEQYVSYKTGLAFEIPNGYVGLLFPRSSNSKKDLLLSNSVGVLDSGYRGEVEFRYKRAIHGINEKWRTDNFYEVGDRVGQIIIIPFPQVQFQEVNELSETDRGDGGFGSTGIN